MSSLFFENTSSVLAAIESGRIGVKIATWLHLFLLKCFQTERLILDLTSDYFSTSVLLSLTNS